MFGEKLRLSTTATPIELYSFEGHPFFLKRDDLLHPDFSGNKARKLAYFLEHPLTHITRLVSFGSAQSNTMYSLSVLAKMRGWTFEYYVDHIAGYLENEPHGNYAAALKNGMRVHLRSDLKSDALINHPSTLWIEEGARQQEAEYGIKRLADEIMVWQQKEQIEVLHLFLPSGTGTTALYLQKYLPQNRVYTTPCVGDSVYLKEQFWSLQRDQILHPRIVSLDKKHHFGKLYKEHYKIWLKLQQETGVVFDLLYDPLGWRTLLVHKEIFSKPVLYIHQGGLLGNESMLARYERKYKDKV